MPNVVVLNFGSSVLRSLRDLHIAVDEIYRRWRGGLDEPAVAALPARKLCRHECFLFFRPIVMADPATHRLVSASTTQRNPRVPALSLLGAISSSFPC